MTTIVIGSLFAGYGGLDLAIADVFGATTAWVSDVDPGANAILAHRYPDAPNLGDITRVDWATVPRVDIISGGSPCQDLSHAGRRAGMTEGTRSNLWVSMREAIATIKPTFVVWENVHGALSASASSSLEHCPGCMGSPEHGGPALRALGRVLGDLADLGYDAQWHGLRAADVGACHGRFRVFVLAYAHDAGLQGQPDQAGAAPTQRHGHPVAGAGGPDLTLLPTPRSTDGTKGGPSQRGSSGDLMLPSAVVHLLPTPTTTQRGTDANLDTREGARANLHNEVVKLLPTPTTEPTTGNGHARNLGGEVRMLPTPSVADTQGGRKSRSGERNCELLLNGIAHANRWGDYAEAIARHEQAFGHPAPAPTEPGPKGNPRLSARFVEWMQMLPAGWVTDVPGVTRNQALKALGNGVCPPQCVAALRIMLGRTIK